MQKYRGGAGGGGGPSPRGLGLGVVAAAIGAGGLMVLNNSLFNVDGGHRAIKYTRVSGVGKQIYSEGTVSASPSTSSM